MDEGVGCNPCKRHLFSTNKCGDDCKRKRLKLQECNIEHADWQASLGKSLAEQVEKLTVARSMNARQVKKLLRTVLTNEDVVSAFRSYINGDLAEPETGQLSAVTKRRAMNFGILAGCSSDNQLDSSASLGPRVLTRALAQNIQKSLQGYLPIDATSKSIMKLQPRTILDMDFSEDSDITAGSVETIDGDKTVSGEQNEGENTDKNYEPSAADLLMLKQDRILDMLETSLQSSSHTQKYDDIDNNNTDLTECSSREATSGSSETSFTLDDSYGTNDDGHISSDHEIANASPVFLEHSEQAYYANMQVQKDQAANRRIRLTPNSQFSRFSEAKIKTEREEMVPVVPTEESVLSSPKKHDQEQPPDDNYDDEVYAEFLRSLFTPENRSTSSTPKKPLASDDSPIYNTGRSEIDIAKAMPQAYLATTESDGEDDSDDPEFDVMSALEQVDREDLFDELRDDRAVRVSKLEAKILQQDLCNLFSEDEEEEDGIRDQRDQVQLAHTRASTIYAVRSQCHRILQQQHLQEKSLGERTTRSSSTTVIDPSITHSISEPSPVTNLTEDQLQRLKRQLGMHIQQLTTSFLCTYDLLHLRYLVCQPAASALKVLIAHRDEADRQHFGGAHRSLLWSSLALPEAVKITTDYAGLSMLPLLRRVPSPVTESGPSKRPVKKLPRAITIPLPTCLLRLFTNNPVWSYPYLLPKSLPAPEHLINPVQRKRLIIHAAEDALMLMGLADFLSLDMVGNYQDQTSVDLGSQRSLRCLPYRSIQKHLLPFRSLIQLRGRRTNLVVAGKLLDNPTTSPNLIPLAMRHLIRVFRSIAHRCSPLSADQLQQLANEIAVKAVPNRVPLFYGCISEYPPASLFDKNTGVPLNNGYETVLPNLPLSNCTGPRSEWTRVFYESTTDFVMRAECMWWSSVPLTGWTLLPTPTSVATHAAATTNSGPAAAAPNIASSTAAGDSGAVATSTRPGQSASQLVLKPEDMTTGFPSGSAYFPAIPVDITSEGWTVNHAVQLKAVELAYQRVSSESNNLRNSPLYSDSTTTQPPSNVCGNLLSIRIADSCRYIHQSGDQLDLPSTSAISSSSLVTRPSRNFPHRTMRLSSNTLFNLRPMVAERRAKLPIPPLRPISSTMISSKTRGKITRLRTLRKRTKQSRSKSRKKALLVNVPVSNPVTKTSTAVTSATAVQQIHLPTPVLAAQPLPVAPTTITVAAISSALTRQISPSVPGATTVSSPPSAYPPPAQPSECAYASIARSDPGLPDCQKLANQLLADFNHGLDCLLCAESDQCIDTATPRRAFPPNCEPSPWHRRQASETHSSLDGQVVAELASGNLQTTGRFLHRCRARGEATTADLVVLRSSLSPSPRQGSAGDEHDIHHARSLLDRCRIYLPADCYTDVVLTLGKLNQLLLCHRSAGDSGAAGKRLQELLVVALQSVKNRLMGYPALLDDFIFLLTTNQAWQLRLLPTHLRLHAISRVQRVLQELVPRGKRFWRRLRNLANSLDRPIQDSMGQANSTGHGYSLLSKQHCPIKRIQRHRLPRTKQSTPLSKTWHFLESTWRNRPILMSQISAMLNGRHKPYSGFEMAFEHNDCLARNASGVHRHTSPGDFTGPLGAYGGGGWEVCTELSTSYRPPSISYRAPVGVGRPKGCQQTPSSTPSSWSHRSHCSCPCHSRGGTCLGTGHKAAACHVKSDGGGGLRHCIACSLWVHRGIVYVAEGSAQLRPAHITWPPDFVPKSSLAPAPSTLSRSHRCLFADQGSTSSVLSTLRKPTASTGCQQSTRTLLNRLARSQKEQAKQESESPQFFWPSDLDLARHRIAVEFLPPVSMLASAAQIECSVDDTADRGRQHQRSRQGNDSPHDEVDDGEGDEGEYDALEVDCDDDDEVVDNEDDPVYPHPTVSWPSHSFGDDDEAACFNTEAFFARARSMHQWQPDEDRQLLEFCKAKGRYSSQMFTLLTSQWVPSTHGVHRSAKELEERFKLLMQATLGTAFDAQLFNTPRRVEEDEDDDDAKSSVTTQHD